VTASGAGQIAERWLSHSRIEQIALRCGFGSPVLFRQHFRRATATSPTAYRRAFRARDGSSPMRAAVG
jgi:transcriptional regulator GlxA family with amidase domain